MSFRVRFRLLVLVASVSCSPAWGQGKVIQDKAGVCRLTVPADWSVSKDLGWVANAPANQGDVQLVSLPRLKVTPLSEASQKALLIGKMFSNTPQSVFYSNETSKSANPLTPYRAAVPAKEGSCVAMFAAHSGLTEDAVKKIAATLSVTK